MNTVENLLTHECDHAHSWRKLAALLIRGVKQRFLKIDSDGNLDDAEITIIVTQVLEKVEVEKLPDDGIVEFTKDAVEYIAHLCRCLYINGQKKFTSRGIADILLDIHMRDHHISHRCE